MPKCRHPETGDLGNHPSLFEVERRRHRKVKGLTANEQVQGERGKRTPTLSRPRSGPRLRPVPRAHGSCVDLHVPAPPRVHFLLDGMFFDVTN